MTHHSIHQRVNSGRSQALNRSFSGKNMSTLSGRSPYRNFPENKNKTPLVMRAFALITTMLSALLSQH
jgi:hypothetical protein